MWNNCPWHSSEITKDSWNYIHTPLVWKFCLHAEYWPSSVWFRLYLLFFLNIYGYVFGVQHFFIEFYVMTTSILNTPHQHTGTLKCATNSNRWYFTKKHLITIKCRKLQTNIINCLFSKGYNFSELNEESN